MSELRYVTLFAVSALLLAAGFIAPVYAHANLIRSDPPANSILSTYPHQVTLYFTEQVEPKLSGAAVYDSNGKEMDRGYSVNPTYATIITVSLPPLPYGVYTVSWHAISAVDGHHTAGSFSFGIGNVTIPDQSTNTSSYTYPSALEVTERWVNLLADAIFLGGSIFVLVIWNPTLSRVRRGTSNEYRRRVSHFILRLLGSSAVIALIATVLLLIVQATAAAASASLSDITRASLTILTSTRIGEYWIFRLGTVALAITSSTILLERQNYSQRSWSLVLIVGLVLSLSTSITSHNTAATIYYPSINLLSDWVHLVFVGAWIGGLAYLLVAILCLGGSSSRNGKLLGELIRRFSSVAVICVGMIGITGTYNLLIEVGSLTALLTTVYGKILLLKLALFAPMIAFGAFSQIIVHERMFSSLHVKNKHSRDRGFSQWSRRLGLSLRTEMTLGIVLLLIVGLLTASAPVAQTTVSASQYQPTSFITKGYSIQGVNVTMKIFPFQAGDNNFEIDFTNPEGIVVPNIRSVFVRFTYLDKNIGGSIGNGTASSRQGVYTLDGTYLGFSGNWRAEVWAQRSEGYDVIVPFKLDVPAISLRFSEMPLSSDSNPYGIAVDHAGVVWFAETGSGKVASYDPTTDTLSEYPLPRAGSKPFYIAIDNNGAIWLTETQYNQIVMFDPSTSSFKEHSIPTLGAVPGGMTVDKNGIIWFTEEITDKIGRLEPSTGNITEFQIPTSDSIPIQVATDSRGRVWFTESKAGKIGMLVPDAGMITEFQPSNATLLGPTGITISPDESIWFTEHAGNRITEFDPQKEIFHSYVVPNAEAYPFGLAYHDDRLWFVEHIANAIGSFDMAAGTFTNFPIPNNNSDVQLLAIDQVGNVWFTLPASNTFGVLTPTTSTLQLVTASNNSGFTYVAAATAIAIGAATVVAFILGQRRMRRKTRNR